MSIVPRLSTTLASLTARFLRDRRGSYLVLFAVMLIPMVGAVGLAIDTGRGYLVKSKLSYAIDSAGLAAGQLSTSADPTTEIQKYFDANFPQGYMGATVTGPTHSVSADGKVVTLNASASLDTTFMRVLGYNNLDISSTAEVSRSTKPIDLVLAIDMSGSMDWSAGTGSRIEAARSAATTLVNALFGSAATSPALKIGIVPWSFKVNVTDGSAFDAGLTTTTAVPSFTNPTPFNDGDQSEVYYANNAPNIPLLYSPSAGWPGCVYARYNWDYSVSSSSQADDEFGTGTYGSLDWEGWEPTYYSVAGSGGGGSDDDDDDDDGSRNNFDSACPDAHIAPLESNKANILATIAGLTNPNGGTIIPQGLAWAWRVLMPNAPFMEADMNPDPVPTRMIVLLTDGENDNSSSDAYSGYLSDSQLDDRLRNIATAIKAQGVEIVTIQFANSGGALQTLMQQIASSTASPHYFYAPDADALELVFQQIGEYVESVHLSK